MMKVKKTEWRVVVYPVACKGMGDCDAEENCRAVLAAVQRHVDGVGSARIEYDIDCSCSYCGALWVADDEHYNGGCCDNDEAAEQQRRECEKGN